jgi:hypothetical protein
VEFNEVHRCFNFKVTIVSSRSFSLSSLGFASDGASRRLTWPSGTNWSQAEDRQFLDFKRNAVRKVDRRHRKAGEFIHFQVVMRQNSQKTR